MDRFFAHVRRSGVKPGELIPPCGILTATDWIRLRILGLVAETRRGVFVLTAKGDAAVWHNFPRGAEEITVYPVGDIAGWRR